MQENITISEYVSNFLKFISEIQKTYDYCFENQKKQEDLTQDLLHSLELDGLKCAERSKVATQLAKNRQERRKFKDQKEEAEPIIEWISKKESRTAIEQLKQALGSIRKVEKYHHYRCYIPKFSDDSNKEEKSEV